jgi:hypothetical protein
MEFLSGSGAPRGSSDQNRLNNGQRLSTLPVLDPTLVNGMSSERYSPDLVSNSKLVVYSAFSSCKLL